MTSDLFAGMCGSFGVGFWLNFVFFCGLGDVWSYLRGWEWLVLLGILMMWFLGS